VRYLIWQSLSRGHSQFWLQVREESFFKISNHITYILAPCLESSLNLEIVGLFFSGDFGPFFQKNPLQKLQWISYCCQEAKNSPQAKMLIARV